MSSLVSIIVPVHNRPIQIREAVQSVLCQTYRPIEIIIIDDGSTDGITSDVLAEMKKTCPEIKHIVRQNNQGPGVAREKGRGLARGQFIQYLDSDDLLLGDKLAHQISLLKRYPECGLALGMSRIRRSDGRIIERSRKEHPETATLFPTLLNSRWWGTSTALYRRDVSDRAGPWPGERLYEDWQYEAQVAALRVLYCFSPQYVVEIRHHSGDRLSNKKNENCLDWLDAFTKAHIAVYAAAKSVGVSIEDPEMQQFVHQLIQLARECGRVGLRQRAARLLRLAAMESLRSRHKGIYLEIGSAAFRLLAPIRGLGG